MTVGLLHKIPKYSYSTSGGDSS